MAKSKRGYIIVTILLLVLIVVVVGCSYRAMRTPILPEDSLPKNPLLHGNIELPEHSPNDSLIYNRIGKYTLQYSPSKRSALWVAYKLTYADTHGGAGRSSSFRSDRELQKRGFAVASNSDYANSGYDKGHLLPSADRQKDADQNSATCILSNCSPQSPSLNRGMWKNLEESIR